MKLVEKKLKKMLSDENDDLKNEEKKKIQRMKKIRKGMRKNGREKGAYRKRTGVHALDIAQMCRYRPNEFR